jgi:hypothetical protein
MLQTVISDDQAKLGTFQDPAPRCMHFMMLTRHAAGPAAMLQTVISDDQAKLGTFQEPAPRWVGNIIAWILNLVGPKGLEFAKYSIDYHYIRNWLYVNR